MPVRSAGSTPTHQPQDSLTGVGGDVQEAFAQGGQHTHTHTHTHTDTHRHTQTHTDTHRHTHTGSARVRCPAQRTAAFPRLHGTTHTHTDTHRHTHTDTHR